MKIELYLRKINQEKISTEIGLAAKCGTYVSWTKECCVLDFHRTETAFDYLIRPEPDGYMLWDSKTGSVYKLDDEAYRLITEIEKIKGPATIDKEIETAAKRANVPISSAKEFLSTIRKLKLA